MQDIHKPGHKDAFALFPDIMKEQGAPRPETEQKGTPFPLEETEEERPEANRDLPAPPAPPNVHELLQGAFGERILSTQPDAPVALLLMTDNSAVQQAAEAFLDLEFELAAATSVVSAMEKLKMPHLAAVVLQEGFGGQSLQQSAPHQFMRLLPMERRRYIHYTLIGPRFRTLYDLEALAASANLVINEADLLFFDIILRKGLQDYEKLFGPYIEMLKQYAKK